MLSGVVGTAFSTAISISAAFDAGNIKVVSTSATAAVLEIKPDPLTELEQKARAPALTRTSRGLRTVRTGTRASLLRAVCIGGTGQLRACCTRAVCVLHAC